MNSLAFSGLDYPFINKHCGQIVGDSPLGAVKSTYFRLGQIVDEFLREILINKQFPYRPGWQQPITEAGRTARTDREGLVVNFITERDVPFMGQLEKA